SHVRWMGRDAGLTCADNAEVSAEAFDGAAAAAWHALVARLTDVVEVRASCTLQEISSGRRSVPELTGCAGCEGARQHGIALTHALIGHEIRIAHGGTDPQAPIRQRLDLVEIQMIDIDEMAGCFDLVLHEIEKIGSTGNEPAARSTRNP